MTAKCNSNSNDINKWRFEFYEKKGLNNVTTSHDYPPPLFSLIWKSSLNPLAYQIRLMEREGEKRESK